VALLFRFDKLLNFTRKLLFLKLASSCSISLLFAYT